MNQNPTQMPLNMKPDFNIEYRGKIFEIVTWEGKPGVKFEAAARAPGVRLIIEMNSAGEKALLMTRELRREAGGYDFRLPGGKVYDTLQELDEKRGSGEIDQDAYSAAVKEGKQEAGISGGTFELLEVSRVGSSVEWDLYYYLVTGAEVGDQELEEHEIGDIETVMLSPKEIYTKLVSREIKEGRSADMLWWWLQREGYIKFENS